MPDYAADPATSARKPVPSTRKPAIHETTSQTGWRHVPACRRVTPQRLSATSSQATSPRR
jgi:hypothetical protein